MAHPLLNCMAMKAYCILGSIGLVNERYRNTETVINGCNSISPALSQRQRHLRETQAAFTRLELVVIVATFALLAGLVLPTMGNTKSRHEQVACVNNLRQIGRAFQLWGDDHGDNINPARLPNVQGGLNPMGSGAPWIVFAYLKRELVTPTILVCPSDTKKMAKDWSTSSDGGYCHNNYRDGATSYFTGLHAFPDEPFSILSGDHNLRVSFGPNGCEAGVNNAWTVTTNDVRWTNSMHINTGNILFSGGAVQQLSSQGLKNALNMPTKSSCWYYLHILTP